MSLRRRGPNEDWEFLPPADRVRALAWESLPLGRIAVIAAALVLAYVVVSGTFSSAEVSLGSGDACEDVLLRNESQQIHGGLQQPFGNDLHRPDAYSPGAHSTGAYGQCVRPTSTPIHYASAPTRPASVPVYVPSVNSETTCDDPGYDATLLSPTVPDASDTYTYLIDGCQPDHEENGERSAIQWQDVDFVKFSGCWEIEDIEDVYASSGTVELVAPGYVRVSGISDADLPLTVEILFHDSLKSGDERTWIWIHTGPADNDGWTQIVGGPFCDGSTPTPTDPPTPTPTKPPTPTPTEPPTPTPTEPPLRLRRRRRSPN